jgi:hypothetical protein
MRRGGSFVLAASLALAALAPPRPVVAAPPAVQARDAAAAEALFERARRLSEAGQFEAACPLFAESHRLDPAVGVLLYLAACHESTGRIATAWATFREARAAAESQGQLERVKIADARIAALEARLPRMRIVVPPQGADQGWTVRRDDLVLGAALWDTEMPVDPGERRIEVLAPGFKPYAATVQAREGVVTRVELPPLTPDTAPIVLAPAPRAAEATSEEVDTRWRPIHTTAVVLGGAGVVGLALGTGFGVAAASEWDTANAHCRRNTTPWRCDAIGVEAADDTGSHAAVSTTAFVLGGAALATGAVLWLVSPELQGDGTDTAIQDGPGDVGLSLAKRF